MPGDAQFQMHAEMAGMPPSSSPDSHLGPMHPGDFPPRWIHLFSLLIWKNIFDNLMNLGMIENIKGKVKLFYARKINNFVFALNINKYIHFKF